MSNSAPLPQISVVLAMSADGKISDRWRSPARFGSSADKAHLERRIAQADAMLFGAGTLRSYGTTLRITNPDLLNQRQQQGKPPQPIQIVCSRSGRLDPSYPFFRQAVPRWLLTTPAGAVPWQQRSGFDRILIVEETAPRSIDLKAALQQCYALGIHRLVVGGGSELVAALLAADVINDLWLTICPLLFGGAEAPTPVGGEGFLAKQAPRLKLLSVEAIDQEVFLHYQVAQLQA